MSYPRGVLFILFMLRTEPFVFHTTQMTEFIGVESLRRESWGWKDPRLCGLKRKGGIGIAF